jgi:hypothetical protein
MAQRLREIAEHSLAARVPFFCQQADIIGESDYAFEIVPRFPIASLHRKASGEPAGAGYKGPFRGPVGARPPVHRPILDELSFDCGDSPGDAPIINRQKVDQRQLQQAGINGPAPSRVCTKLLRAASKPSRQITRCMRSRKLSSSRRRGGSMSLSLR